MFLTLTLLIWSISTGCGHFKDFLILKRIAFEEKIRIMGWNLYISTLEGYNLSCMLQTCLKNVCRCPGFGHMQ